MSEATQSIFRSKALDHYTRSREKDVLPRTIVPPVFLCMWLLLALCLTGTIVSWLGRIPVYVSGVGVVQKRSEQLKTQPAQELIALLFIPTDAVHPLHLTRGTSVLIQIGSQKQQVNTTIDTVEPGVLSPREAQQNDRLRNGVATLITGPSIMVSVKLGPAFQAQSYVGSSVNAQVQVNSRRVLSLLPGLGSMIGE